MPIYWFPTRLHLDHVRPSYSDVATYVGFPWIITPPFACRQSTNFSCHLRLITCSWPLPEWLTHCAWLLQISLLVDLQLVEHCTQFHAKWTRGQATASHIICHSPTSPSKISWELGDGLIVNPESVSVELKVKDLRWTYNDIPTAQSWKCCCLICRSTSFTAAPGLAVWQEAKQDELPYANTMPGTWDLVKQPCAHNRRKCTCSDKNRDTIPVQNYLHKKAASWSTRIPCFKMNEIHAWEYSESRDAQPKRNCPAGCTNCSWSSWNQWMS